MMSDYELLTIEWTVLQMGKIAKIINDRMQKLLQSQHRLEDIFEIIHMNEELIFSEESNGYQIKRSSYGDTKEASIKMGVFLSNYLSDLPRGSYVGLMMENSGIWINTFWGILMAGYQPMLLNVRLGISLVNEIIELLNIKKCLCDMEYELICETYIVKSSLIEQIIIPINNEFTWANQIALSTSATSLNLKICVYDGERISQQILNSKLITKQNKMIKTHYNGSLKLLTFLPFYHIFGLMATYFWFAFFGRCFVFLKDYSSDTIMKTVRLHHVTHVFGVPMLWQAIYSGIIKAINSKGEKIRKKFNRGIKLSLFIQTVFPFIGKRIANALFKTAQQQVFGNSIKFLISGGGYISPNVLRVINGIGYPLYNGYGMSEIGISSVELRVRAKKRCLGSIGKPFASVEYQIDQDNCLLVKGKSLCKEIITKHDKLIINNEWFNTHDLAMKMKGYYYIVGRQDDIVITPNGEKINPDLIEKELFFHHVHRFSVLGIRISQTNYLSLVLEIKPNLDQISLKRLLDEIERNIIIIQQKHYQLDKIFITYDMIASPMAIKVSRSILTKWIKEEKVHLMTYQELKSMKKDSIEEVNEEISQKIKTIFSSVLGIDKDKIGLTDHFIFDLGGTSLEYLSLLVKLQDIFSIDFVFVKDDYCYNINQFTQYIINYEKDEK